MPRKFQMSHSMDMTWVGLFVDWASCCWSFPNQADWTDDASPSERQICKISKCHLEWSCWNPQFPSQCENTQLAFHSFRFFGFSPIVISVISSIVSLFDPTLESATWNTVGFAEVKVIDWDPAMSSSSWWGPKSCDRNWQKQVEMILLTGSRLNKTKSWDPLVDSVVIWHISHMTSTSTSLLSFSGRFAGPRWKQSSVRTNDVKKAPVVTGGVVGNKSLQL